MRILGGRPPITAKSPAMTTTLNKAEVLHRAYALAKDYASASYEMGQAQNFIRDLCEVFGFSAKRLVSFEQRVSVGDAGLFLAQGWHSGDAARPGARQHPPSDVEQETFAQAVVAGDEVQALGEVNRPERGGRSDALEGEGFEHGELWSNHAPWA